MNLAMRAATMQLRLTSMDALIQNDGDEEARRHLEASFIHE